MNDRQPAPPRRRRPQGRGAALATMLVASALALACKPGRSGTPPGAVDRLRRQLLEFAGGVPTPAPAYTLTASDGTDLRLAILDARAVVQGPLAFTQLRLSFDNWSERTIEGRFEVMMPEGAAISRFAMKIGDSWQEGEVVERLQATRIYESFLHRRVDPALLEHDAGNKFRARVFPIFPRSRKELILSYTQELADPREPYRLPLLGLPHLDALYVQVFVSDSGSEYFDRVERLNRFDYVPEGDLVLRQEPPRRSAGVRHGSISAARVYLESEPAAAETAAKERVPGWTILVDTSASQAIGFAARISRLKPLIAALGARAGGDVHVEVVAFDQERVNVYSGPASRFGPAHAEHLVRRGALGASDLESALREIARTARAGSRLLLVSDGIATAGEMSAAALTTAAMDARAAGVGRIDALVAGPTRDPGGLRAVVGPSGSVVGAGAAATPADSRATDAHAIEVLVDRLHAPVLGDVGVVVPGSRWVWPRRLDGVQPGDSVLVYAEIDEDAPLRVQFAGAPLREQAVPTTTVERPLLERAWRGAQLRDLLAQHDLLPEADPRRAPLREQIVETSLAHRVLSPFTALLVLETEDDYRRFGLDRRALADILVVGDAGLEVLRRDLATALERTRQAMPFRGAASEQFVDPATPPDFDTDRDFVPDIDDRCPTTPEDLDGHEDWDGCPDLLKIDNCQIKLADRVHFRPRSADLTKQMHRALDEVVATLNALPDVEVFVEGHADSAEGPSDQRAKQFSQRRVDAVRDYLVNAGIDPIRLEPIGWGEEKPIDTNKTAKGRANNRRVEFNLKDCRRPPNAIFTPKGWHASRRGGEFALEGRSLDVDQTLAREPREALRIARAWWSGRPGDVLAALALGRALAATGRRDEAARAYGSLIDLAPSRAEFRRHAGERLEALGALDLAIDTYREAVRRRPDHPSGHRLLACALARLGRHSEAFTAIEAGLTRSYPAGRFPGILQLLGEDLAILGAAWIRYEPAAEAEVKRRLAARGLAVADAPSLRFVLLWETDATDLDLHVLDARGHHHDIYASRGWRRRADNTSGFGPEPVVLDGPERAYPYTVNVHYTSRGAMGDTMGAVHVLEHDGHGRLGFLVLPFVLMREGASLDIGAVEGPLVPG